MPQLNKGGKYVFGLSTIGDDCSIKIPDLAYSEYNCRNDEYFIAISGSKTSGGFCITSERLLKNSELQAVLDVMQGYNTDKEWVKYKGRKYGFIRNKNGVIQLSSQQLRNLDLNIFDKLMCIRSSNIAFTFIVKGPLIERAKNYSGVIETY